MILKLGQLQEGDYFKSPTIYEGLIFRVQHKLIYQMGGIGVIDQIQPYGIDNSGVYHPSMEVIKIEPAEAQKKIEARWQRN